MLEAEFILYYEKLEIGRLSKRQGDWHFQYSETFKKQSLLRPLLSFLNPDHIYKSKELWPFFAVRIPSLKREEIAEKARANNVSADDTAGLLKLFGRRTISNPFLLESSF